MDEDVASGAVLGGLMVFVVMLAVGCPIAAQNGKAEIFRDIANQRCAPQVALISSDDPYRYACVPR